jgi:CRISPR system Cascade subunit CasA
MMTEKRFNLVKEKWIPVADKGLVSLKEVFSEEEDLRELIGTPLQKIALFKLFIAIAQAACTPEDDSAWAELKAEGMSRKVNSYLEEHIDEFWLYGDKPFLQMPAVADAKLLNYGAIMPEVASGNTTRVTQWQVSHELTDADKALVLLVNMSCCFGGKQADKTVVLSKGHIKKSAKSGPALCSRGLLHNFLLGKSLRESIWLNLQTRDAIAQNQNFPEVGTPPWEEMPQGEICDTAQKLMQSLMGRLVPMARFCLLQEDGLHYVEGIQHPDYQEGYMDPSVSRKEGAKKTQMLWCDPGKRPWRSITALLAFLHEQDDRGDFTCPLLRQGIERLDEGGVREFGIWSGGVRVTNQCGEQKLSGKDDMVESIIFLDSESIYEEAWFPRLEEGMHQAEKIGKILYAAVAQYFTSIKDDAAREHAATATHLFWQMAEAHFQTLLQACDESDESVAEVIKLLAREAYTVFTNLCPCSTARQIQAWAQHRPRLGKFFKTNSNAEDKAL